MSKVIQTNYNSELLPGWTEQDLYRLNQLKEIQTVQGMAKVFHKPEQEILKALAFLIHYFHEECCSKCGKENTPLIKTKGAGLLLCGDCYALRGTPKMILNELRKSSTVLTTTEIANRINRKQNTVQAVMVNLTHLRLVIRGRGDNNLYEYTLSKIAPTNPSPKPIPQQIKNKKKKVKPQKWSLKRVRGISKEWLDLPMPITNRVIIAKYNIPKRYWGSVSTILTEMYHQRIFIRDESEKPYKYYPAAFDGIKKPKEEQSNQLSIFDRLKNKFLGA